MKGAVLAKVEGVVKEKFSGAPFIIIIIIIINLFIVGA